MKNFENDKLTSTFAVFLITLLFACATYAFTTTVFENNTYIETLSHIKPVIAQGFAPWGILLIISYLANVFFLSSRDKFASQRMSKYLLVNMLMFLFFLITFYFTTGIADDPRSAFVLRACSFAVYFACSLAGLRYALVETPRVSSIKDV